jgi:hypothetical protein
MFLHDIVDDFRFNASAKTAMGLARELAKYPHLFWDVCEHTRNRAANYLRESDNRIHQYHARFLTQERKHSQWGVI